VSGVSQPGWNQPQWQRQNASFGQQPSWPAPQRPGAMQWPQQTGNQPWGPPAPARSNKSLRNVLVGLICVCIVAIAGLAFVHALGSGSAKYQNDTYSAPPPDLKPPPLPEPSQAEAESATDANLFYQQTVPQPIRCTLPRIQDAANAADPDLQTHLDDLTACLMKVWNTPTTRAGYQLVRPSVTIYDKKIDTACGSIDNINAFYCAADQQVYYSRQLFRLLPDVDSKSSLVIDFVLGHEFGHALQGRTGILVGRIIRQHAAGSKAEQLEINRRLEMQADCFSGMFMRAIAQSSKLDQNDVTTIKQSLIAVGDPAGKVGDHGQSPDRLFWGLTGFATPDVGKCNTFIAPVTQVR